MNHSDQQKFHVFISHSTQDREWAEAACKALEKRDLQCWIAPRNITPGTEWGAAIIDGIDRSQLMLLVFSSNANESAQVRREVERAIGKSIPVLPLRIEDIKPAGAMEFALSNTHWLDAFNPPVKDRLRQLGDAVEALVGSKATAAPSANAPNAMPVAKNNRRFVVGGAIAVCSLLILSIGAYLYPGDTVPKKSLETASTGNSSKAKEDVVKPTDKKSTDVKSSEAKSSEAKSSDGKFVDVTSDFQGRWVAVEESRPRGGVFEESKVKERHFTITIQDHHFAHRRKPTETETASLDGSVTFESNGKEQIFSVRGADQDGKRLLWNGIWEMRKDSLLLCYRERIVEMPKDTIERPLQMQTGRRTRNHLCQTDASQSGQSKIVMRELSLKYAGLLLEVCSAEVELIKLSV